MGLRTPEAVPGITLNTLRGVLPVLYGQGVRGEGVPASRSAAASTSNVQVHGQITWKRLRISPWVHEEPVQHVQQPTALSAGVHNS